ncbi:MAG: LPS export ABC transporter periplasmic protein LptC [Geminocystis sp.]|nr:LPS export ABC transporter periplasmic protein LptC [Geminocystis sp.]MCS7148502.1 LPS export ABC transporter periplasmic protein LptC [Geminocystis sp.]MDW8114924.1 LPS export ABC transporter periplasmic protein LptC [Geminocystis sp.]MDW8464191.1 LPS export ABC transporter periplasmic protein LptC [Geminocystis sp.]
MKKPQPMLTKVVVSSLCLSLLMGACQGKKSTVLDEENSGEKQQIKPGLVLYNSIIEQSNARGQLLWRLRTKRVSYTQEDKIAKVEGIIGNLYENNRIILQLSADGGEVTGEGKEIYMQGNILVVDTRNKVELKGEKVVWKPEENYLKLTGKNKIKASHENMVVLAEEAEYDTKRQILRLKDNIKATTKQPTLQLSTSRLDWQVAEDKIIGDKPLTVIRYQDRLVADIIKTDRGKVDLNQHIATISGNVEYQSLNPLLIAATSRLVWYYDKRQVEAPETVLLKQPKEEVTITANRVNFDMEDKKVYMRGGVYGRNHSRKSEIYADEALWDLAVSPAQIQATGNVSYKQSEPPLLVRGIKAWGSLASENILVEGIGNAQVVTTIEIE